MEKRSSIQEIPDDWSPPPFEETHSHPARREAPAAVLKLPAFLAKPGPLQIGFLCFVITAGVATPGESLCSRA